MKEPLVSCLCVTKHRPLMLARSIRCFLGQTYVNKELVIILPEDDPASLEVIESFNDDRIKYSLYKMAPGITIGALRNISVEKSAGSYFCQWDDDDWYHPRRVETQLGGLKEKKKEASVLAYYILFDATRNIAFSSFAYPWPQTILCNKLLFQKHQYPDLHLKEDAGFVSRLVDGNFVVPITSPSMYVYVYHSRNTCADAHFDDMAKKSVRMSDKACEMITKVLSNNYSPEMASSIMDSKDVLGNIDYFSGVLK